MTTYATGWKECVLFIIKAECKKEKSSVFIHLTWVHLEQVTNGSVFES